MNKTMINCPKCESIKYVKAGFILNKQRYKCKNCIHYFTINNKGCSKEQKRLALELYLEGLGFRSVGRVLKVSHVAVHNWIKEFGRKLSDLKSDKAVEIVEIDEMHSYINSKKTSVGFGLLLIDLAKDSLTSLLAVGEQKQVRSSGTKLKTRQ